MVNLNVDFSLFGRRCEVMTMMMLETGLIVISLMTMMPLIVSDGYFPHRQRAEYIETQIVNV